MTVVWFNPQLVASGGGERFGLEIVSHLRTLGVNASVLAYEYDPARTFDGGYAVPITTFRRSGDRVPLLPRLRWLRRQIKEIDPDWIIVPGTWSHPIEVYLATLWTRRRYVAWVFGSLFAFSPEKELTKFGRVFSRAFHEIRRSHASYQDVVPVVRPALSLSRRLRLELHAALKFLAVNRADHVMTLSAKNLWETEKLYRRSGVVLRAAFPASLLAQEPAPKAPRTARTVLTVSRLVPNKRVDLCIRAFHLLHQREPDTQLVVGGTGPEEVALRALTEELGLSATISFIGFVPEDVLWHHYRGADVFLSLDLADFDIAPLEALALGTPVVWSDEMERDESLSRHPFLYSAAPTPIAVADTLSLALRRSPTRTDLSASRQLLDSLTWEHCAHRLIAVLTSLGAEPRAIRLS